MADNRFFRLIEGTNIFGEVQTVETEGGHVEILIKHPYTVKGGNVMPYMVEDAGNAPGAIQIHPMNVLWTVPLDEFKEINEYYKKQTSQIITPTSNIII